MCTGFRPGTPTCRGSEGCGVSANSASLRPHSEAELAQLLAAPGPAFELVAGGTKRGIGRPVQAQVLDVSGLCGIVDYQPGELVLSARPGTPLAQVEALLGAHGQRLGFEPPECTALQAVGEQTLGGVLMANSSGSRRVTGGSARDHFIGLRAVNGRGEVFVGGGRVVKNVTGFDLPKALAGSWGTLAVLTEVTVRLVPRAEFERTVFLAVSEARAGVGLCSRALGSMFDVSAAAFIPRQGVALRLEGLAASVQSRVEGLLKTLEHSPQSVLDGESSTQFWRGIGAAAALAHCPVIWRISVAPRTAPQILEALQPQEYLLDWGGGLIWMGALTVDATGVRNALKGGHATLIKAPEAQRRAVSVFQPLPPALATIATRLKAAFDPDERLNPGRMS